MKKIYSIVALVAIAFAANAQRQAVPSSQTLIGHNNSSRTATDTLWWLNGSATPVDYVSVDQNQVPIGFVCGNDGYGDVGKVEAFANAGNPVVIDGGIYWFGYKAYTSGSTSSTIAFNIYQMNGTGTNVASAPAATAVAPGTILSTTNVTLAALDTSLSLMNAQIITFPTAIYTANDFAMGFDMTNMNTADTVGFVSSTDGDGNELDMSWEKWANGSWHSFLEPGNWALDFDLAIFPIVEMNTGVNETPFLGGVKMGFAGPNPTTDNTVLSYGLQNNAKNVTIRIVDAQGRLVSEQNLSNQAAGNYTYAINSSSFAAGTYFVQLQADNSRLAVKMVKN
jgi:hypothetical protein